MLFPVHRTHVMLLIVFTPIHGGLGLPPSDLTWSLIEQAVGQALPESASLDWKLKVHETKGRPAAEEFAKDVAAMANSGGGWIFYGVREQGDCADRIEPVDWNASIEQRLRQVVYAYVSPPLTGLQFYPVADAEGSGSVVGLRVPDAPDRPYFITKDGGLLQAPRRDGAHTVPMPEREIEAAFRSRFQRREDREDELTSLYAEQEATMDRSQGVGIIVVASPQERRTANRMGEEQARDLVKQPFPNPFSASPYNDSPNFELRRGFRRWIATELGGRHPVTRTVHEDGTVTVVRRLGDPEWNESAAPYRPVGEPNQCLSVEVEENVSQAISLVARVAQRLNIQGGYTIRSGLAGQEGEPIWIRASEANGNYMLDHSNSVPIHHFRAVTEEFDPFEDSADLLPFVGSLCLDLINQGGVRHLRLVSDA